MDEVYESVLHSLLARDLDCHNPFFLSFSGNIGGQEWSEIPNFIEDFSVTTNPLGTPHNALEAAKEALTVGSIRRDRLCSVD